MNIAAMNLPRPRLPLAPVLSRDSLRAGSVARPPSVLDAGQVRLVTSGRIAIALALERMGVGAGDEVLLPAYHSPSMVPPVLWRQATPRFYRLRADTSVDLDDITRRATPATRVLVVTHYFGFPQAMAALRAWCDARGIFLLEDCAHAFFGAVDGRPLGTWGDYAIASSMKFFPVHEGGCLVSARHRLDGVTLRGAGPGFEAKALLAVLETSFRHGRLALLGRLLRPVLRLRDLAWGALKRRRAAAPQAQAQALAPASSDSGFEFEPRWLDKRSAWFSRLLVRSLPRAAIGARRRRHYQALEQMVRGLPGCRPLYPTLPEGVYPWQFPLLCDDPEALFMRLQQAGVPLVRFAWQRWPAMDAGTCEASSMLARSVLALPCHQELRADELEWIGVQLRQALSMGAEAS